MSFTFYVAVLFLLILSFLIGRYTARIPKVAYGLAVAVMVPVTLVFLLVQLLSRPSDAMYESAPMFEVLYFNLGLPFVLFTVLFYFIHRK